jgi:hypothetical protein
MAFMTNGKRDYKKELAWEKRNPQKNRQAKRVIRNKNHNKMVADGSSKHVDHKDGNPMNNKPSNLQVVSASYNLLKEANRKKFKSRKT